MNQVRQAKPERTASTGDTLQLAETGEAEATEEIPEGVSVIALAKPGREEKRPDSICRRMPKAVEGVEVEAAELVATGATEVAEGTAEMAVVEGAEAEALEGPSNYMEASSKQLRLSMCSEAWVAITAESRYLDGPPHPREKWANLFMAAIRSKHLVATATRE